MSSISNISELGAVEVSLKAAVDNYEAEVGKKDIDIMNKVHNISLVVIGILALAVPVTSLLMWSFIPISLGLAVTGIGYLAFRLADCVSGYKFNSFISYREANKLLKTLEYLRSSAKELNELDVLEVKFNFREARYLTESYMDEYSKLFNKNSGSMSYKIFDFLGNGYCRFNRFFSLKNKNEDFSSCLLKLIIYVNAQSRKLEIDIDYLQKKAAHNKHCDHLISIFESSKISKSTDKFSQLQALI